MLGSAIIKDGMPFSLHYIMFVPTLMGQGTANQQAYWIGRAWNCEFIGTYAQACNVFRYHYICILNMLSEKLCSE